MKGWFSVFVLLVYFLPARFDCFAAYCTEAISPQRECDGIAQKWA
jgi:hypothetical protein